MGKDRQINETEKQIQQIQTKLNSLEVESESARF